MGSALLARDPDKVIDMWKMHNSPFFAIFEGKNEIIFCYDQDDENSSEEKLRETLHYISESQSQAQFTVRIYADGEKITNKKEYKGSIPFKFSDYQPFNNNRGGDDGKTIILNQRPAAAAGTDPMILQIMQQLQLQNDLIMKLMAQDEEPDEEEEEPDPEIELQNKTEKWVQIGTTIAQQAMPILTGLMDRIWPQQQNAANTQQYYQSPQISGVMNQNDGNLPPRPDEQPNATDGDLQEAIQQIIAILGEAEFRRVMVALGKMAQNNPAQLQMVVKMVN